MSFGGLLLHTIDILRYPVTYDNAGDPTLGSPTSVASDVECLIQARRGSVRDEQRGWVSEEGLIIFMAHRADVRLGDVIEVTAGPEFLQALGSSDERWYVDYLDDAAGQGHHIELTVLR